MLLLLDFLINNKKVIALHTVTKDYTMFKKKKNLRIEKTFQKYIQASLNYVCVCKD